VLGIYGQNGSGKTAFIEALWILKMVLLGESLPGDIKDNIYQVCFQHNDSERIKGGDLAIALSEPTTVPERVLSTVKNVIENLNIVLKEIISDLTIKLKSMGKNWMRMRKRFMRELKNLELLDLSRQIESNNCFDLIK